MERAITCNNAKSLVARSVWSVIDLPSSSAQHDGTIGFGFLKHFNITIDLKRH